MTPEEELIIRNEELRLIKHVLDHCGIQLEESIADPIYEGVKDLARQRTAFVMALQNREEADDLADDTVSALKRHIYMLEDAVTKNRPLELAVRDALRRGLVHTRKKVKLSEVAWPVVFKHLQEEIHELSMAIQAGNRPGMLEELADVYGILVHMTVKAGFSCSQVELVEVEKLKERLELDPLQFLFITEDAAEKAWQDYQANHMTPAVMMRIVTGLEPIQRQHEDHLKKCTMCRNHFEGWQQLAKEQAQHA